MVVISISGPTCMCGKAGLASLRQTREITWFMAMDGDCGIYRLYAKYITSHEEPYLPSVILIDKNLNVQGTYGFVPAQTLSSEIESLLNW